MLEKNRLTTYLQRILDAIKFIEKYDSIGTIGTSDPRTLDACLMQLIHIGETTNKIFKLFPDFDTNILPKEAIKLRNFIAHDYIGVNTGLVRKVIKKDLPEIKKSIQIFLDQEG